MGSMYARKHFPVEYKRDAEAIAETVKKVTTVCIAKEVLTNFIQ